MAIISVDFQGFIVFLLVLLFSVLYLFVFVFNKSKRSPCNVSNLPPSPRALPLIGHLHLLLSSKWQRSLQKLSSKYGPLLYLRVFNIPIVLVSSASTAYEVYRTQDLSFSSRDVPAIGESILFGSYGFISAPYGDYWKFMKKLLVTKLLGQRQLERSRGVRGEELKRFYANLVEKARKVEAIDVGLEMMKLTNNSICKMVMGRKCSEENGEAEQIRDLVTESFALTKKFIIASALNPFLKKLGISLFRKEIMDVSHKFDSLLEKFLREHEENPNKELKDMMDILLKAHHDEKADYKITRNHIKSFFVELFLGGTDTSARTIQWTMAELINNPEVLKKVRDEMEHVVGRTRLLCETDLPNLPYLQAVVKEGLRLHPPGPVLPRKCREECTIQGFDIPQNTTIVVNVCGIMRDPKSWENPNEFQPERFMASYSSGQDEKERGMNYIPFGAGRRGCPGANLAYIFMGTAIGTMVQCFEWRIIGEKVNMEEVSDLNPMMAHPLECTPVVRSEYTNSEMLNSSCHYEVET